MKSIKSFVALFLILICFSSCFDNKRQCGFPTKTIVSGLFTPVVLQPDSSVIYLTDFFPDTSLIDSFSVPDDFAYSFDKKEMILTLFSEKQYINALSELKVFSGSVAYSIMLKRSSKIKKTIYFEGNKKEYTKVQAAGEFNNWNPSSSDFILLNGTWQKDLYLEPGIYQYRIVADGKWMLNPANPDSADNNIGGYNSVLNVVDNGKHPVLFSQKSLKNSFSVGFENADSVFVLWQNYILPEKFLCRNDSTCVIIIPAEAETMERSYFRVFASNRDGCSNDLLIPLKYGKIISDASNLTRFDMEAQIMYFMMVDRFFDGDSSNDHPVQDTEVSPKANYMGGDFEGIIQKTEEGYFDSLGINTFWISPVNLNPDKAYKEFPEPHRKFTGYHGYWPISSTKVDYRFGTDLEFLNLVRQSHRFGINVVLDYVANHIHEDHPLYKQHPDWYTVIDLPDGRKNIRLWDEQRLTTWFDTFLPTLDFSKPEVVDCMTDSALYWINAFKIDGFRHDATKHIPENYWRRLTQKIKNEITIPYNKSFYQIGETYGSRELIGSYVNSGELNAQFDFNLFFDMRSSLLFSNESFSKLSSSIVSSLEYYGYHNLMGNITGNHDMARFISYASGALTTKEDDKEAGWKRDIEVKDTIGYRKLSMLTALVMTLPGVPVIYYGDEIGMSGAGDPDNRRMMKFDKLNAFEKRTKEIATKLIKLRRSSMPLIFGDFTLLNMLVDKYNIIHKDILSFARNYFGKTAIIIINKGSSGKEIVCEIPENIIGNNNEIELKANFGSDFKIITDKKTGTKKIELKLNPCSFEILTN